MTHPMARGTVILLTLLAALGACGPATARTGRIDLEQQLREAIRQGRAGEVRRLIAAGANVNLHPRPLEIAILAGDPEIVHVLIEAGAELDCAELRQTVERGHEDIALMLLDAGADPTARDHTNTLCLEVIARSPMLRVFRRALKGVRLDQLHPRLLRTCNIDVLDPLLGLGMDPNGVGARDVDPALFTVVQCPDAAPLDRLLAAGADIDAQGRDDETALLRFAKERKITVIRRLLARGADPRIADRNGDTPLIRFLDPLPWDPYHRRHNEDTNPGEKVGPRRRPRPKPQAIYGEIAGELLDAGADPNRQNHRGRTALMHAVSGADWPAVRLLFAAGADASLEDREGHAAWWYYWEDVMDYRRPVVVSAYRVSFKLSLPGRFNVPATNFVKQALASRGSEGAEARERLVLFYQTSEPPSMSVEIDRQPRLTAALLKRPATLRDLEKIFDRVRPAVIDGREAVLGYQASVPGGGEDAELAQWSALVPLRPTAVWIHLVGPRELDPELEWMLMGIVSSIEPGKPWGVLDELQALGHKYRKPLISLWRIGLGILALLLGGAFFGVRGARKLRERAMAEPELP